MVDQNPQVNQNINNQNENDELFGGSDDIFENSDLLQPINSEVDTAHQVIKSQNDLNNFHGEVKNATSNQADVQLNSDDLFEDSQQGQPEFNEQFDNLYDETPDENQTQNNDISANDDIFEEEPVVEDKIEEIPEIDNFEEDESQGKETVEEVETEVKEPEVVDAPEMVKPNLENDENVSQDIKDTQDTEDFDDIDELDDIDEIQDWEDDNENTEEGKDDDIQGKQEEEKKTDENEDEDEIIPADEDENDDDENDDENENDDKDENKIIGVASSNTAKVKENVHIGSEFIDKNNQDEEHKTDEEEKENITIQDYEKYDPNLFKTDVQKKFGELQRKTEKIHELVGKDQDVGFDLLGGNDDRKKIIYRVLSGNDYVEIEKEELNKEDESTVTNLLSFELDEDLEHNKSVKLYVNDIELYDEIRDLQNDPNKKMQVLEKMNKFIFLLDEEYKKIQKYKKEKEERNAVKGVFRNF